MGGIGAQYAGDVDIEEALLISPTGNITDLKRDVVMNEVNIFEDMFKSSITGNIIIKTFKETDTRSRLTHNRMFISFNKKILHFINS